MKLVTRLHQGFNAWLELRGLCAQRHLSNVLFRQSCAQTNVYILAPLITATAIPAYSKNDQLGVAAINFTIGHHACGKTQPGFEQPEIAQQHHEQVGRIEFAHLVNHANRSARKQTHFFLLQGADPNTLGFAPATFRSQITNLAVGF